MAEGMISRIHRSFVGSNCPPRGMTLPILLLLSLAALLRPIAAMSRIEGAAANLTASTYSVAAGSSASSMQQRSRRRKRSLVFPTGSDLSFNVGLSIPIAALSATSEFPIDEPHRDRRRHNEYFNKPSLPSCYYYITLRI